MKYETVLNALIKTCYRLEFDRDNDRARRQQIGFSRWILNRDERQRAEIEHWKSLVPTPEMDPDIDWEGEHGR